MIQNNSKGGIRVMEKSLETYNGKYMTTKELAQVLDVDVRTVQLAVQRLSLAKVLSQVKIRGQLSFVFNEEQATLVKMEIEKHHNRQNKNILPKTMLEKQLLIKQAMMLQAEIISELQAENDRQKELLTLQAPKVEFYDCVTESTDTIDMAEVAKVLNCGMGRNKLFELLRAKKIFNHKNQPYQKYVDLGLFRIIETRFVMVDGTERVNLKTVVFQKGLDFIRKCVESVS